MNDAAHRAHGTTADGTRFAGPLRRAAFIATLAFAFVGFVALGTWQMHRLGEKRDLIERVNARVGTPPGSAPERKEWSQIDAPNYEYRHIALDGQFLPGGQTRVQAVTRLGAGWWLMAPLRTNTGDIVLINRGFVANDAQLHTDAPPASPVRITGLLRLSEPGGAFLRSNAPAQNRWYSRDVGAIAASRGLDVDRVAPYFVDADAVRTQPADEPSWPVGGLTVTQFANNHVQYALTWYTLALMTVAAAIFTIREDARRRRRGGPGPSESADARYAPPR